MSRGEAKNRFGATAVMFDLAQIARRTRRQRRRTAPWLIVAGLIALVVDVVRAIASKGIPAADWVGPALIVGAGLFLLLVNQGER